MIDVSKVRSLQSLSADIPDERIEIIIEISSSEARSFLGAEHYDKLAGESDSRLEYGVCALAIAKLIVGSRSINEGSSVSRSEGWGEGTIHPSEINEIIRLSKAWESKGTEMLSRLRAEIPVDIGWVDI